MAGFCPECFKSCELHGVKGCAICHKHEDECDIGSCLNDATRRLSGAGPMAGRRLCTHHAFHPAWGWLRAGCDVVRIERTNRKENS